MEGTLRDLAILLEGTIIWGNADDRIGITEVTSSSHSVNPGSAFVAIRGVKSDGHTFLPEAVAKGASLLIVEQKGGEQKCPTVLVKSSRRALSKLVSTLHNKPSHSLLTFGITGTNGKTTINWLIYNALRFLGIQTIRLGTLGTFGEGVIDEPDTLTSPDASHIHAALGKAVKAGFKAAVLETSSHALAQDRMSDVAIDVGIFSNLTRDHLDYHGDMESYYQAKRKLFELISLSPKDQKIGVVNIDDPYGERIMNEVRGLTLISTGKISNASFRIKAFSQTVEGSTLIITHKGEEFTIRSGFIGEHNASNLTQVFAALTAAGFDAKRVISAIEAAPMVPGRLQRVRRDSVAVYVDYAHTPDALENVLKTLRPLVPHGGQLWAVFGCGGDRDRGKRPQMAEIAKRLADKLVVTSDNPRTEDPDSIISDILSTGVNPTIVEPDRRRAIIAAVEQAGPHDIILLAGKGHEDYQIIGTSKHRFSDVEAAEEALGLLSN